MSPALKEAAFGVLGLQGYCRLVLARISAYRFRWLQDFGAVGFNFLE
jgi:hypothetical protein